MNKIDSSSNAEISGPVVLTPSQEQIANIDRGKHLVTAPPGSGKTELLVQRLKRALSGGVDPSQIACLTFTNRAARNMQERVGVVDPSLHVGNFHALAVRVLKEVGVFTASHSVLDDEDAERWLSWAIEDVSQVLFPDNKHGRIGESALTEVLQLAIPKVYHERAESDLGLDVTLSANLDLPSNLRERWREHSRNPDGLNLVSNEDLTACFGAATERYGAMKAESMVFDFSDLLIECAKWLQNNPDSINYDWIQVDEGQDLNDLQWFILNGVAGSDTCLVVFADPQQSIYSFIGADLKMLGMQTEGYTRHELSENWRSPEHLLELYRDYLSHNFSLNFKWTSKIEEFQEDPNDLLYITCDDGKHESSIIARRLLPYYLQDPQRDSETIAILTRTNNAVNEISNLIKGEWDHFKVSCYDIFRRRVTKDFMALLNVVASPERILPWECIIANASSSTLKKSRRIARDLIKAGVLPHWLLEHDGEESPPEELAALLDAGRIVVFDTETTGTNPFADDIVQIAAVEIIKGSVGREINLFLHTSKSLDASSKIHGITESDLKEKGMERGPAFEVFLDFVGEDVICAHNLQFDRSMLEMNLRILGKDGIWERNRALCTLELARALDPHAPNHKLKTLISQYNIEGINSHDALDDARATARLAIKLGSLSREKQSDASEALELYKHQLASFRKRFRHTWQQLRTPRRQETTFGEIFEIFLGSQITAKYESDHISECQNKLIRHMEKTCEPSQVSRLLDTHLERYSMYREPDLILEGDRVILSTVHRAKGLEFDTVVVANSNDYPFFRADTEEKKEEEKRLLFVALTRARRRIIVFCRKFRIWRDEPISLKQSPFLLPVLKHFKQSHQKTEST